MKLSGEKIRLRRRKKIMINVVGAGLAGSEAALQVAACGVPVNLYEMKPKYKSPAHKMDLFLSLIHI